MNVLNLKTDLHVIWFASDCSRNCPYMEYQLFNTDIDPGGDFMESDSGETSIDAPPGPGFRKPGPGSSDDSSYVECAVVKNHTPIFQ